MSARVMRKPFCATFRFNMRLLLQREACGEVVIDGSRQNAGGSCLVTPGRARGRGMSSKLRQRSHCRLHGYLTVLHFRSVHLLLHNNQDSFLQFVVLQ